MLNIILSSLPGITLSSSSTKLQAGSEAAIYGSFVAVLPGSSVVVVTSILVHDLILSWPLSWEPKLSDGDHGVWPGSGQYYDQHSPWPRVPGNRHLTSLTVFQRTDLKLWSHIQFLSEEV